MGSAKIYGVEFRCYADDHHPPHVHAMYAGIQVIVDLCPEGMVSLADRVDAVRPRNASRSDVRHVLRTASDHHPVLMALWEELHGRPNRS